MKVDQKNSKGLMAEFRSLNRCERLVCLVTAWDGGYVNESSGMDTATSKTYGAGEDSLS